MPNKRVKKVKLIKDGEFAVRQEVAECYCDFCGTDKVEVFTSSFDDRPDGDGRKCEMQICVHCVEQLAKFIGKQKK